jgi:hypothetical protein
MFETQIIISESETIWNYRWTWIQDPKDVFIELNPEDYPEYYI